MVILQDGTPMKQRHHQDTKACVAAFESLPEDVCHSVGDVLARVGDKWSILVIHLLSRGSIRFSELKRNLGSISQKVLTTTLRGLERDGYVTRTVTPTSPPRVDYTLTALGREVLEPVTALAMWAFSRRHEVEASRSEFDRRAATRRD
jgi:DNA-binding HxlR family transcriptional regulator